MHCAGALAPINARQECAGCYGILLGIWNFPSPTAPQAMTDNWQKDWDSYEAHAAELETPFAGRFVEHRFDYLHPVRLQSGVPKRLRKAYAVSVYCSDWGPVNAPPVVCIGGVANCAHRFHFLAAGLRRDHRVICMDWVGRGRSGWLADQSEYSLETCIEQLRQALLHFGVSQVTLVGSSLGGTAAMLLAARHPQLVGRLILNDTGPFIPAGRRRRRAETLARHYVFRTPAEMGRKIGISLRNDGPLSEDVRLYNTYQQTRWSENEHGRVYRHDPRALMAYREDAHHNVNIWHDWSRLTQPILVMHGMESDALLPPTLRRMMRRPRLNVIHIPDTGHTPVLDNPDHIALIASWLQDPTALGTSLCAVRSTEKVQYG